MAILAEHKRDHKTAFMTKTELLKEEMSESLTKSSTNPAMQKELQRKNSNLKRLTTPKKKNIRNK